MGTIVQSNLKTTLSSSLGNAAANLQIFLDVVPENSTGYLVIDPEGSNYEIIYYSSKDSTSVTCPASNGRGLSLTATTRTTVAANRKNHGAGIRVIQAADHYFLNDKGSTSSTETWTGSYTFSGDILFTGSMGVPVYADATARDAAITSPTNGMEIYNTALGVMQDYIAGAWASRATGTTFVNASDTVAGKVEMATEAEIKAGTSVGGTGARLATGPPQLAGTIQDTQYIYAADAEASDTYAITLVPAVGAYLDGQTFVFKANTANTGAATLNVNGLGAIDIKKNHDQDTVTGDMEAGGIYLVTYDSTGPKFQLHTASNQSHVLIAGASSNADSLHTHSTGATVSLTAGETLAAGDVVFVQGVKEATLDADSDSYINEANPTVNYGTDPTLQTNTQAAANNVRRTLMHFDISAYPSTVTKAFLRVTLTSNSAMNAQDRSIVAYNLSGPFTEGTVTWNNSPGIGASTGTTTYDIRDVYPIGAKILIDITTIYNSAWSVNNYGLQLRLDDETSGAQYAVTVGSSENGTASKRPDLILFYTDADEGRAFKTNSADTSFGMLGIVQEGGSAGDTVKVGVVGDDLNQSGLTIFEAYKADSSGGLTASSAALSRAVATSTTSVRLLTGETSTAIAETIYDLDVAVGALPAGMVMTAETETGGTASATYYKEGYYIGTPSDGGVVSKSVGWTSLTSK